MDNNLAHTPPEVGPRMDFLSEERRSIGRSEVVKVWSIQYGCKPKLSYIDTLQVEVRSGGAPDTKIKTLTYDQVVKMEGGQKAITRFNPEFDQI